MTKYPLGLQTFADLRAGGYAYVDKTQYVYQLVNEGKYYFLSRPRRFGKSLLLSTLQAYFEGKKELFAGLAIERLEAEWRPYPVLHFDFSLIQAQESGQFEASLLEMMSLYAEEYGVELKDYQKIGIGGVFGYLLRAIAKKTNNSIVVLIDEYDKGLMSVLDNEKRLEENTALLQPFFAQLKGLGQIIKFVMITGVARFHHLTLFSGFNNLTDISLDEEYAAICGITQSELDSNFMEGLGLMAEKMGVSVEELQRRLRQWYDSYRFSESEEKVYNPYSLMRALKAKRIGSYWLQTTTSRVFLNFFRRTRLEIDKLDRLWASDMELSSKYSADNPVALLYQTGYLTIMEYRGNRYRLGIPNGEVRAALVDELLPNFMDVTNADINFELLGLGEMLRQGEIDKLMLQLKSMIASIPYQELEANNLEKTYHLTIYLIFLMIGVEVRNEISMSGGRIDMVAKTDKYVYVFEFKLNGSAQQALAQIDDRGYAIPWESEGKEIYKIGVSFSGETRTIGEWAIARG